MRKVNILGLTVGTHVYWSLTLGLIVVGSADIAAQDEVTEPASDLPKSEEEDLSDAAWESLPESKPEEAADDLNDDMNMEANDQPETWDSYSDPLTSKGVAQEITGGVRVEDIVEPPADYRFAAFGKADPFVPPMVTEDDIAQAAAQGGILPSALEIPIVSPLQKLSLSQLALVGIWQLSNGERKAMVMGAGQGIIVKNGDPIGNRGGRVLAIGDAYLTVREFMLAPDGTRQFEDHQMYLGSATDRDLAGKIRFVPGKKDPEVVLEDDADAVGLGPAINPATEATPSNNALNSPSNAAAGEGVNQVLGVSPRNQQEPLVGSSSVTGETRPTKADGNALTAPVHPTSPHAPSTTPAGGEHEF